MSGKKLTEDAELDLLQREAFHYFLLEANPDNGLVVDKTQKDCPSSIAATGFGLACYPVAVERGFMSRAAAVQRTLATLRFFFNSPQGPEPDSTGYKGFYYHFLDMKTGRRAWNCELSTVDTTFLIAGVLLAGAYFDADTPLEREIRDLAEALYGRVDWLWAEDGNGAVAQGWNPESGFIPYRWDGYDEGLLLYILGLGSPSHPLPPECYPCWTASYRWDTVYDIDYLYAGPLFEHQLSHIWIDFRRIQDAYMAGKGIDYFENSRRATFIQQKYAVDNPKKLVGYSENCWGISASDGPGVCKLTVDGTEREFFAYYDRGVPYGPDDGTISPWAVVASLPFAPEIVLPVIDHFIYRAKLKESNKYGFKSSFNATYPEKTKGKDVWVSPYHFGINQGPIVLMIENYRTGLLWQLMRSCPYIVHGLKSAGFSGGWLG